MTLKHYGLEEMRTEYKLRLQFSFSLFSKLFFSAYINIYKIYVKSTSQIILLLFVPRKRRHEVEEISVLNYLSIIIIITYMYSLHQIPGTLPSAHIFH